ncbi:MAG: AAA family ATPase [Candidatus Omnitrophota bacterium]
MKTYIETWEKIFGIRRAKRVFVSATRQNVGKTTVSLGLISTLKKQFGSIGFIKPVGQRYLVENGYMVDEDSVLMNKIFKFKFSLQDMSPVAVEKGYTERFLDGKILVNTALKIKEAFEHVADGKDLVIIEGTGHAGVGSVFDLSNAAVAKMLESKVIMVSSGGIGNAIDEIMLNKSVFDRNGVKLAGVVVNKVRPDKYDKVNKYVRFGLNRLGIPVLGVIPYIEALDMPTMRDFKEELSLHVLCGEEFLDRQMKKVFVGAMEVKEAAQHFEDDCLVITPAKRSDIISFLIKLHTGHYRRSNKVAGVILSGGHVPKRSLYNALKKTDIPVLMSPQNTYEVAAEVHDLTVKIKSRDVKKVELAIGMVEKYVDMEQLGTNMGWI